MINVCAEHRNGFNYLILTPEGFSEDKKYPIIIHLHGAGSRGVDALGLKNQTLFSYASQNEDFPFVVFMPRCKENSWFDVFLQLREFVRWASSLPFADADRIFLSGVSMGGYASWQMLMSEPDIFSKAVICCGGGMYWNAGRIKAEVWAFHGLDDPTVFYEESVKMVNAVNRSGGKARLTSYEGVGHNSWGRTYSDPRIYAWLLGLENE